MKLTPTSLFSKEDVISTGLDPIFNLYNVISMVIMFMMQMIKMLSLTMICTCCTAGLPPQMSLESEEPYSTTPRKQSHPGLSGECIKGTTVLSRICECSSKPTCPQADWDSGSQTTAATLSLVHWIPRFNILFLNILI